MTKPPMTSSAVTALLVLFLILYAHPTTAESFVHVAQETATATTTAITPSPGVAGNPETRPRRHEGESAVEPRTPNAAGAEAPVPAVTAVDKPEAPEESSAALPPQPFVATAYSLRGATASGLTTARGIIAADRRVLPLGTCVRLTAGSYSGEYVVGDTGGAVRGRKIDIWMPNNSEARRFGRRMVKLAILTAAPKKGKPLRRSCARR